MEEITIGCIKSTIEYGLEHGEDKSAYYRDLGMDVMEVSNHLSLNFSKLIMGDLTENGVCFSSELLSHLHVALYVELSYLFLLMPERFLEDWMTSITEASWDSPYLINNENWSRQPVVRNSTLYELYCSGNLYLNLYAYSAYRAVSYIWRFFTGGVSSWETLFEGARLKKIQKLAYPREVHRELAEYFAITGNEFQEYRGEMLMPETYGDQPLHGDEGDDSTKRFTMVESVIVVTALLKQAKINQADNTAIARLISQITGYNAENIRKKLNDPYQGADKVRQKRMSRIMPYITDLNNEDISLIISQER
ncbi:hypothetical protein OAC32_01215 [bacterium]|nr:hypothetical protein [bacterium]